MAKKPQPLPKYITDLIQTYERAQTKLILTIQTKKTKGNVIRHQEAMLKQVNAEITKLNKLAADWVQGNIPEQYKKGVTEAVSGLRDMGASVEGYDKFSQLHTRAIEALTQNAAEDLINANNFVGRQVNDAIRQGTRQAIADKLATGGTIRDATANIMNILITNNGAGIRTKNGRMIPLRSYAETVARTTTREATNRGTLNHLVMSDRDLVKMDSHNAACKVCAPLEGRVYSISGKSTEYPPLSKAYSGVHANIHPNCRHVIMPYIPELADDPEADKQFSNRPFDTDPRSQAQVDAYNKRQADKYELNKDRKQWERYKMALPDDTPKTLSSFRAMKRVNSERFQQLQSDYRSLRQKYGADEKTPMVGAIPETELVKIRKIQPVKKVEKLVRPVEVKKVKEPKVKPVQSVGDSLQKYTDDALLAVYNKGAKNNGTEYVTIVDKNGYMPLADSGTYERVEFSSDMVTKIRNGATNSLNIVHNHPNASGFSTPDVSIVIRYPSLYSQQVVDVEGNRYFFSVGKGRRDITDTILEREKQDFNALKRKTMKDDLKVLQDSGLTYRQALSKLGNMTNNEFWEVTSKKYGWEYKYTPKKVEELIEKPKDDRSPVVYNSERRGHIKTPENMEKLIEQTMDDTGFTRTQTIDTLDAVERYTSLDYQAIRGKTDDENARIVARVEDYITASPKFDGQIYRGMKLSKSDLKSMLKNKEFDPKGISSWSSDKSIAKDFAIEDVGKGQESVVIVSHDHTKASSIRHLSAYEDEQEVLMSGGAKFRVIGSYKLLGQKYTTIEVSEIKDIK